MPSKVYAISNPSAAIALRYGANVSRGIGKMEEIIKGQSEVIKRLGEKHPVFGKKYVSECDFSGPSVRGRK
jgi:hypothetical protein